ncbi:MAG TPA: hypothetical protein DDZ88_04710 [Verrucomicrobiales bacterium]|nr:hypothetical protein [Verrucomicrobiales bacterium]
MTRTQKPPQKGRAPSRHAKPGQPTKVTLEFIQLAVKAAKSLCHDAGLCQYLRVHPSTWCDWKNKAAQSEEPYAQLFREVEQAQAVEELELVKAIKNDSDWRAKLALLERRWPKRYALKQIVGQSGVNGTPATTDSPPPLRIVFQGINPADNPYEP